MIAGILGNVGGREAAEECSKRKKSTNVILANIKTSTPHLPRHPPLDSRTPVLSLKTRSLLSYLACRTPFPPAPAQALRLPNRPLTAPALRDTPTNNTTVFASLNLAFSRSLPYPPLGRRAVGWGPIVNKPAPVSSSPHSTIRVKMAQAQITEIATLVAQMKVPQLKDVLRELHEKISGNKATLQARIYSFANTDTASAALVRNTCRTILQQDSGTALTPSSISRIKFTNISPGHTSLSAGRPSSLAPSLLHDVFVSAVSPLASKRDKLKFKASPFYEFVERVGDLKVVDGLIFRTLLFQTTITIPHPAPIYELLYFVTAIDDQSLARGAIATVEYPSLTSIFMNGNELPRSKYAGLKGKSWTAQPANITKHTRMKPGLKMNRVELLFAPHSNLKVEVECLWGASNSCELGPGWADRYYVIVDLVRKITVDDIVKRIETHNIISREAILEE
ncbi:hypothetical protein BDK51DRAFT_27310, partial [Blyttiomyces helicus]